VADSGRDADVIASGREPRERGPGPAGPAWLLAGLLAVALVAAVTVAVHYRAEAARFRHQALPATSPPVTSLPPSPLPEMTSASLRLPAPGSVAGTVVITAAAVPGARRAQFTVSAVITGGVPGTVYDLIGNDCSDVTPVANKVWATGLAGPDGTAELTGNVWTGAARDRYWLALDPAPGLPRGLHGQFAQGRAAPFASGQGPCAG
jgi:hypothetical protein